jgi:hypothetical protein
VSASSRLTTDLPSVWPQRFGGTWSSSMIAAGVTPLKTIVAKAQQIY